MGFFRVVQRLSVAEDVPLALRGGGALHVGRVALSEKDAVLLRRHDARRGLERVLFDEQRRGDERIDHVRRDRRDGLRQRFGVNLWAQLRFEAQEGLAGGVPVEDDHVAGIDPMRIPDLGPVHAPDFRPAPWLLEKACGNVPKRVAGNHDVLVRSRVGELRRRIGGVRQPGGKGAENGQDER